MDYDYDLDYRELQIDQDPYYYTGENDEDYENLEPDVTIEQIFHMCLKPTLYESFRTVSHIFIFCIIYR